MVQVWSKYECFLISGSQDMNFLKNFDTEIPHFEDFDV